MMINIDPTWKRILTVWWAILWRNIIAMAIAFLLVALIGFLLSFILSFFGVPIQIILIVASSFAIIIGLGVSIIPLKMVIGKNFGDFSLVLKENNDH